MVFGQLDIYSTGPGYFLKGLQQPQGLAFDAVGNLDVVDSGNHRQGRYRNAGRSPGGAEIDWTLGQANLSGKVPGSSAAPFNAPEGVAVFGSFLAVADTGITGW